MLSEDRHDYFSLVEAKTELITKLSKLYELNFIFEEMPAMEFKLFVDNQLKRINVDTFIKNASNYDYYLREDFKQLNESYFDSFYRKMNDAKLISKIIPLDIGTLTTHLALFYFADYTKSLNSDRNSTIDGFCDSIKRKYSVEYHAILKTTDDNEIFQLKRNRIDKFLTALDLYPQYKDVKRVWESAFASYFQVQYNLKSFPDKDPQTLSYKEIRARSSFRDSVIFSNFNFYFPPDSSWKNIVISFSTYHLLDTRHSQWFSEVLDSSSHTFGKYLRSILDNKITHIAFICNSGSIKLRGNDNRSYKKSLEYQLSKSYNFAYIDLKAYRTNSSRPLTPFFLRPTFEKFLPLNWEEILDGIVYIKDCGCNRK
jgi:hypothetical protein